MSEIIEEQKQDQLEDSENVKLSDFKENLARPWIRYWARYIDLLLFGFIFGTVFTFVNPGIFEIINDNLLGMLILFLWIIFEAMLLSTWGTTPGKFLLKIKVRDQNLKKLRFPSAFARSVGVWFTGMGIGFPIAALITLIISYNQLTKNKICKWDKNGEFIVLHGKIGVFRCILVSIIFMLFLSLIILGTLS